MPAAKGFSLNSTSLHFGLWEGRLCGLCRLCGLRGQFMGFVPDHNVRKPADDGRNVRWMEQR